MERFMMATKAIHKLGDISREEPDLCVIFDEDADNFIGNWVTGYGFIRVNFPKATTRELTEKEKEKYHGMKIVVGEMVVGIVYTKEKAEQAEAKESPVIVLAADEKRQQQLRAKLEEYKGRLDGFRAPELQMDTLCKIAVLERLLRDGQVKTWDLSREMSETYGTGFDTNDFNRACVVIEDYCQTGGQNLSGGTGLASVK